MRKLYLAFAMTLCISLLTACGSNRNSQTETTDGTVPGTNCTVEPDVLSGTDTKNNIDCEESHLMPEFDYNSNELALLNLTTGTPTASYPFEAAQTPMLVEQIDDGVVMLSSQTTADVQNTKGVSVVAGDDSVETLTYWRFDNEMNLLKKYELTHSELMEGLWGYTFAVSPDGCELIYAVGDCLYCYTFETQNLKQIALKTDKTVYYETIHYSASGNYLAFFGSIADQNGTAYGSVNLSDGTSKTFFAKDFSGMALSVNGEYAAVADTIQPDSMGGPNETGSVLYLDLAHQQGRQIAVETGAESGLAAVSTDGRYLVTCMGDESLNGIFKVYGTTDGVKATEQPYEMNRDCKPYQIHIQGQSVHVVLATESGYLLSPAVSLP